MMILDRLFGARIRARRQSGLPSGDGGHPPERLQESAGSEGLYPIVFDLVGAGLDHAFGATAIDFDLDGNGSAEQVRWLNAGFAFLALDRNEDGLIGSGLEISFVQDKAGAKTDLEGLAAFDSNADGKLTAADARFGDFRVWRDANGDGISQQGEIKTLAQTNIASISLTGTATGKTAANTSGNVILNMGSFSFASGGSGALGDALLRADPRDLRVSFEHRDFSRKSGKYRVSADNGTFSIVPSKAKGVLDPRAGAIGPATILRFRNRVVGMLAPVILDLDGDGVELVSSKKARARFDMDGDGAPDDTGWAGRGDGFLAIDRDGDGRISGPAELSFLGEKAGAKSDIEALSALDSDRNGKIDSADVRFGELRVWSDTNGNGITDAGELKTLADHSIASISLSAAANRQSAKLGDNLILSTGTFTRVDGSTGTLADAALAFKPGREGAALPAGGDGRQHLLQDHLATLSSWRDLKSLEFPQEGVVEPLAAESGEAVHAPPNFQAVTPLDRRSALMAQHMAAFGAFSGDSDMQRHLRPPAVQYDYFTQ